MFVCLKMLPPWPHVNRILINPAAQILFLIALLLEPRTIKEIVSFDLLVTCSCLMSSNFLIVEFLTVSCAWERKEKISRGCVFYSYALNLCWHFTIKFTGQTSGNLRCFKISFLYNCYIFGQSGICNFYPRVIYILILKEILILYTQNISFNTKK